MANKQNFTPEEWTKVLESTMLAGIAVSQADPSGLWGTLKEYLANKSALDPSKLAPDSSELVKAGWVGTAPAIVGSEKVLRRSECVQARPIKLSHPCS